MSVRKELTKEIAILEQEIKILEIKRSRSEASLISSLINKEQPNEEDTQFFRAFTAEIEIKREQMIALRTQLDKLNAIPAKK